MVFTSSPAWRLCGALGLGGCDAVEVRLGATEAHALDGLDLLRRRERTPARRAELHLVEDVFHAASSPSRGCHPYESAGGT